MENYRGKRRFSGLYFFNAMNHRMNFTVQAFDELYEQNLSKQPSNQAAYQAAEKEHEAQTGHRRYSSSESYRVSRSRRIRKR
jgi:hypothetical protein